jgi:hypothetical protein
MTAITLKSDELTRLFVITQFGNHLAGASLDLRQWR